MGMFDNLFGGGSNPADKAGKAFGNIIGQAGGIYNRQRKMPNVPKFDTYVPFSSQTQGALDQMQGLAGQGNPMAGASQQSIMGILGSDPITPEFRQMVDTEAGKLGDDVSAQFGGSSFGSAGHTNALTSGIGDFRNRMIAGQYNQGVANQLGAISAAPGAYEQQYAPAERLAQVGAANDDLSTRKLQSKLDKWYGRQDMPWQRLGNYANIVNGAGQGFANTRAAATPPANPFGGAIGGGMLGASVGMPGLGAGLGLLSGLFGR